ncbi:MAG: response regulator [Candidatus Thermoplasmatota archaeon]
MADTPIRLLIVDDDEAMRMACRRVFERSPPPRGIAISEADSGEQAIEMLRADPFDCVLSDYRMGALTGIEVLAFAMKNRPKAVRIMMSGFGSPDLVMAATLQARIHEFIEKPMTSQELEAVLKESVLERYLKLIPPPANQPT